MTKTKEEETIIINRPDRSTYPEQKSVSRSGATPVHAIGTPAPHFMAWLTILVELLGGLAVLLGAFVPWASIPMAAILLVAIFTVHLPFGFTSIKLLR